jgi:hypothetical protein
MITAIIAQLVSDLECLVGIVLHIQQMSDMSCALYRLCDPLLFQRPH